MLALACRNTNMVQVLITIDTECSLGGAWENAALKPVDPERSVLGKIGSEYYGTPRIMDILEENGLKGTFFVEVFAGLNGSRAALSQAYSQIAKRSHDVQLHLHPIHYYYHLRKVGRLESEKLPNDKDMFAAHTQEKQLEMLRTGVAIFRDMIGETPVAFRAGNFGADFKTLDALEKVGIRFDSSFNASYTQTDCKLDSGGAINRSWQHGNIWEVPITNFQTGKWGLRGLKQLNINAVSLWEMKSLLNQAARIGLRTVNFIAHSFSLFKVADIQFRKLKPDRLALSRLHGLCRFLKENADRFRVVGFSNLDLAPLPGEEKETPNMGIVVPLVRKGVQAVNRIPWI
jgi:peptidoglycan/xylan/chitin deacetylase (PgdA/CDA1 family)